MRRHQSGELVAAERIYREILQDQPNHPLAMQMLGVVTGQQGHDDTAIDLIRRSIEIDPRYPGAYRNLAPLLAQNRRFDEAIAAYRKYLEFRPAAAEIHRDLGHALAASGRIEEAAASFSEAVLLRPDFAEAYGDLGQAFLVQNRLEDAIGVFMKAIALKPEFAWLHNSFGEALSKTGRPHEALAAFRRAVELKPDLAAAHAAIGNVLWQAGRLDEAIAAYSTAVRLQPNFALAFINLGRAYRSANRYEEALAAFRHAEQFNPDDADMHANTAVVLAEMGRFDEALAAHARLAALEPDDAITYETRGEIFMLQKDVAAAVDQFRRAAALDPNLDSALNRLGLALQAQGKFDEAAKCFRHILELCPNADVGLVYGNLFNTGRICAEQKDIERLTAAIDDPNMSAFNRVGAGFALAKMLEEAGRFDEAFARCAQANSLDQQFQTSAGQRYEPEIVRRHIDEMIEFFTPEFFQQRREWGERSDLPVFIVGMPRSGTTLVHQIAASHSQVHGAGELNVFAELVKNRGGTDLKSASLAWGRAAIKREADRHLQYLRSLSGTALRIVDKMPNNIHRLDLIFQLYPAARVIFCRREARDNCLSCYFQRFSAGNLFSCDLAHCGHEFLVTERLTAHWLGVLPMRMLEVQYEDLVADLEGQSRRLIDFLGLPWDPACLDFHRAETTVLTASAWQVRQPIYQSSVGRWHHYERHLGPLLEVLNRGRGGSAGPARPEQSD